MPLAGEFGIVTGLYCGLLLLVRQFFRPPPFWILVALGYIAAYIAQWTGRTVWDPLTFDLGIPQAGAGIVVNMLGRAFLGGAFQIAPGLVIRLMTGMSFRGRVAARPGGGGAGGPGHGAGQHALCADRRLPLPVRLDAAGPRGRPVAPTGEIGRGRGPRPAASLSRGP